MTINDIFATEKPIMSKSKKPAPDTILLTSNRDAMQGQLMTKVRLNRYDMKFMINIADKYINQNLPLSPGQNELYEKIVHKYRKQLKKLKVNYKDIIALPWANGVVDMETLRQQTFFRVDEDNNMEMYFNFNKAHIEEIRAIIHDDDRVHLNRGISDSGFGNGQKYNFNFTNTTKIWSGPFNVYLFKKLYNFVESHNIKIDETVTTLINKLNTSGTAEQWTPSVRIVNDRIYVNHITESMLPALDKIDLADTSVANIECLSKLGLQPPKTFEGIAKYLNGSTSRHKIEINTPEDVLELKDYLKTCDRKTVFFIAELDYTSLKTRSSDVLDELKNCATWRPDNIVVSTENTRGIPIPIYNNTAEGKPVNTAEEVDNLANLGYNTLVTTTPLTSLLRSQSKTGKFALEADKVIYLSIKETK